MKQAFVLSLLYLTISLFYGCNKEELASIPIISTTAITNITLVSMTSGGNITSDGGATVTCRGICWGITNNPTSSDSTTNDGDGVGQFVSSITSLDANKEYHIRAYATNSVGTAYGADILFLTKIGSPTITTLPITDITPSTATSGGNISYDGGSTVTSRGIIWSTHPNQTTNDNKTSDGSGTGNFQSSLLDLMPNTIYYFKAYATNAFGTKYGSELVFKTCTGTITDADYNTYYTITIGTQVLLAENLKTTKYNDGTDIQLVQDQADWNNLTTPGYCYYNNDEATNRNTYGALYNWYTVNTGKLCPTGWHVPTYADWITLRNSLGGYSVAGGKLKATGTIDGGGGLWHYPNTGATNETGFTALPGSLRIDNSAGFQTAGYEGLWWASNVVPSNTRAAYTMELRSSESYMDCISRDKQYGLSVRCLKN